MLTTLRIAVNLSADIQLALYWSSGCKRLLLWVVRVALTTDQAMACNIKQISYNRIVFTGRGV